MTLQHTQQGWITLSSNIQEIAKLVLPLKIKKRDHQWTVDKSEDDSSMQIDYSADKRKNPSHVNFKKGKKGKKFLCCANAFSPYLRSSTEYTSFIARWFVNFTTRRNQVTSYYLGSACSHRSPENSYLRQKYLNFEDVLDKYFKHKQLSNVTRKLKPP